jgi:hypothetical protein
MQRLERREKLPPLSSILLITSRVVRIINGEFKDESERRRIIREIENLNRRTERQIDTDNTSDSLIPVELLILGGTKGLMAILKIESNIVEAAVEAFGALRKLEQLTEKAPDIHDACLGLGLFYCSVARAPAIVRAALHLSGRDITFEKGLNFLRMSADSGRYTGELSSLYLIQFLSPYRGHLRQEKERIFSSLQQRYPYNAYYVFLENDETICFHPDRCDSLYREKLKRKIKGFMRANYSLQRYDNLVRWQLAFMSNTSDTVLQEPDTLFDLKEFSFYPYFLEALKLRRLSGEKLNGTVDRGYGRLTDSESTAVRKLGLSGMSSTRRNFYEWHIRDALRIR